MTVRDRDPFSSWSQSRSSAGSFESVQRLRLPAPVVEHSAAGAKRLGEVYWNEIERSMHGVVRARESSEGVELRVLGIGPALLRFGPPALLPAAVTARAWRTDKARALFGGVAAHAFHPLHRPTSSAIGTTIIAAGHRHGWPVAEGGSQSIAEMKDR